MTEPQCNSPSEPKYPKEARKARIVGHVELEALISAEGNMEEVEVLKGPGFGMDEEAEKSVRRCSFSPAIKDGKPVAA